MSKSIDIDGAGATRGSALGKLCHTARCLDRRLADALRPFAFPALRVLLGLVFVWFGGLKLIGVSPVEEMVAGTLPWVDPDLSVVALGVAEVTLGLGLVTGFALRLVLPALVLHLMGTFSTFVMLPDLMFRENAPLMLTQAGEFVAKNVVLIAATLVLIAYPTVRGGRTAASLDGDPTAM